MLSTTETAAMPIGARARTTRRSGSIRKMPSPEIIGKRPPQRAMVAAHGPGSTIQRVRLHLLWREAYGRQRRPHHRHMTSVKRSDASGLPQRRLEHGDILRAVLSIRPRMAQRPLIQPAAAQFSLDASAEAVLSRLGRGDRNVRKASMSYSCSDLFAEL
jgi:hypothetical protein